MADEQTENKVVEQTENKVVETKVTEPVTKVAETNEFDNLDIDEGLDGAPQQEASEVPQAQTQNSGVTELKPGDTAQSIYIKNPPVGESIILTVEKVQKNDNTRGKNKLTGETFDVGLKDTKGNITRTDIVAEEGTYTISAWEVFYKLFGADGLLNKYGKEHDTFTGAKLKISKNFNGQHANMNVEDIKKLCDYETVEEAQKYKEEVAAAFKARNLYTVELVN